jgi:DNA modification methylase
MTVRILQGDCRAVLKTLPDQSVHCCVTSPPYFGLRDYGIDGQMGLETTPENYVQQLVGVFDDVRRVLRDDGTLWLNLGDCYAGSGKGRNADGSHSVGGKQDTNAGTNIGKLTKTTAPQCKPKDLIGIPWRVAFALQEAGWYLRSDIIWHKPNPMPESVTDRPTKAHEYIFLLSKSQSYLYDHEAVREPIALSTANDKRLHRKGYQTGRPDRGFPGQASQGGGLIAPKGDPMLRNRRSVWSVSSRPFKGAHFATFPTALIEPCILAGCPKSGTVLDPFGGAGTTGLVAERLQRNAVLIELNPRYAAMAEERIRSDAPMLGGTVETPSVMV